MRYPLMMALAAAALAAAARGEDIVQLRDGSSVRGTVTGITADSVMISRDGREMSYARDRVLSIAVGGAKPKGGQPAPPAPPAAGTSAGTVPATASGSPPAASLPTGTAILVRTVDAVDTRKQGPGAKFAATLDVDLAAGETVIAPKGARIYGVVRNSEQAGNLLGKSALELTLTGIEVNGKLVPCVTDSAKAVGEGSGREAARKTGAGALIGAAADGSEGARKGAAVGAGVAVLTSGQSVQVPQGTLLEFRLVQPFSA
jgi:hypothetical protein